MSAAKELLRAETLALAFGGVRALDGVDLHVDEGEIVAVIGPNGAGKTSLLNCLSGVYRPSKGQITLRGNRIDTASRVAIARSGIGRTFQNLGLFGGLDVVENLMLGRHIRMGTGVLAGMAWYGRARREEREHRAVVHELVERLGLGAALGTPVGLLPYGVQKRIEFGRAVAMEPTLLLLDEPVAGMNPTESAEMAELVVQVRRQHGTAVLIVEHDMPFVMGLADRVVALDFGIPIATGTPAQIRAHPRVIAAYLGEPETEAIA